MPDELDQKSRIESAKFAYDHAWNWFGHHADQRMTAFRFFLLVMGIFAVAYYQTTNSNHYFLATCFSLLMACFSILFWRLDMRTRELIKVGEDVLSQTEADISKLSGIEVSILRQVGSRSSPHAAKFFPKFLYSYSQVFAAIFFLALTFSIVAASYAIYNLKKAPAPLAL